MLLDERDGAVLDIHLFGDRLLNELRVGYGFLDGGREDETALCLCFLLLTDDALFEEKREIFRNAGFAEVDLASRLHNRPDSGTSRVGRKPGADKTAADKGGFFNFVCQTNQSFLFPRVRFGAAELLCCGMAGQRRCRACRDMEI